MDLSIVIPIFNEEILIEILLNRLKNSLKNLNIEYEIVIVNDGSQDNTLNILKNYLSLIPSLVIVNLSRNFGHQAAYMAGLSVAKGKAVIMLDGDLQDPPELIPDFFNKWKDGYEVVVGARKNRKDTFFRKVMFNLFHKLFSFLSDYPIFINSGMFSLIDQKVKSELLHMKERNRFIPALRDWLGFKSTFIWYERDERSKGSPKQTIGKLFGLACDAIFSFSYKPLRIILIFGLIVSMLSFSYAFILMAMRILKINYVKGFTTAPVAIFFLGGTILISMGIIGEYLGRIYDEVKSRQLFIISDIIKKDS